MRPRRPPVRWLTWLYPRSFRERYGDEMLEVLEQDHAARQSRNQRAGFWWRSILGALRTAPGEHAADLGLELRHVVRGLVRRPLFLIVSVASLSIGIAASATVLATVSALFLEPLPGVDHARQLVNVKPWSQVQEAFDSASFPDYADLRDQLTTLQDLAAFSGRTLAVQTAPDQPATSELVQITTANFATVIGASPARGRYFSEREIEQSDAVAVVSEAFWRERLGQPEVLPDLFVNGSRFRVVGVGPSGFQGLFKGFPSDVFLPLGARQQLGLPALEDRSARWLELVGRRAQGATLAEVGTEADTVVQRLVRDHPDINRDLSLQVEATTGLDADYRRGLLVFLAALGVLALAILTIATLNVAGMMAGRNLERRSEVALRTALGAPGHWLARRVLFEAATLALLAAMIGSIGAWLLAPVAGEAFSAVDERIRMVVVLDVRTVLGIFALTLVTTLLAAMAARPGSAGSAPIERGHLATRQRGRRLVVVAQVAISFLVLTGAGLFSVALDRAAGLRLGFDADRVATARLDPGLVRMSEDESSTFFRTMLERIEQDPAIQRAALTTRVPLSLAARFFPNRIAVNVAGLQPPADSDAFQVEHARVSSGFFTALGIAIEDGRAFDTRELAAAIDTAEESAGIERRAVVNRAFVDQFFAGAEAVGQQIDVDGNATRVIGVAATHRVRRLDEVDLPMVYLSLDQQPSRRAVLLARARGAGDDGMAIIRRVQGALAPQLPVQELTSLRQSVATAYLPQRIGAASTTALGLLALLLSAVGLYGVVAQWMVSRTAEIGLRASLGASPADLVRLVLRQGMTLTLAGVVLGVPLAIGVGRLLVGLLYGLDPLRPTLFLSIAAVLATTTLLACVSPARRALRVPPQSALRGS